MTIRKKLALCSLLSCVLILAYNIYHAFWWYDYGTTTENVHFAWAFIFILCCGFACATLIPLGFKVLALFCQSVVLAGFNIFLDLPFFLFLNWWCWLASAPSSTDDILFPYVTFLAALASTAALLLDIFSLVYRKSVKTQAAPQHTEQS